MTRIGISMCIKRTEKFQLVSSDVRLITTTDEGVSNDCNAVLMLGLPYEMPNEDFPLFIEPFLQQLVGYNIIVEELESPHLQDLRSAELDSVKQCKKFAILAFDSFATKEMFVEYYNNIQVPLFSEIAPCIVVALDHVDISLSDADAACPMLLEMMQHNTTSVSFPSPANGSGRTSRCMSSPQTTSNMHSPPHSASKVRLDSLDQTNGSHNSITADRKVKMLPTCVVCLRRICSIGSHIPGAGALKICRSYTYDSNHIAVMRCCTPAMGFPALSPNNSCGSSSSSNKRTPNNSNSNNNAESGSTSGMVEFIRCFACAAYNSISDSKFTLPHANITDKPSASSSCTSFSARCMDCGLSDGIWLCMICCHTGCGRYKARHAQQHYLHSGHSLSLVLASGLIWDYRSDAYVHVDDVSSPSAAAAAASSGSLQRQSSFGFTTSSSSAAAAEVEWSEGSSSSSVFHAISPPTMCGSGSGAHNRSFLMGARMTHQGDGNVAKHKQSDAMTAADGVSFGKSEHNRRHFTINSEDVPMLDSVTVDKMNHLIGNYESLLQSQLNDQQMYFEKMLARETVRALELTYHRGGDTTSATGATAGGKNNSNNSKKNQNQQQQHRQGSEYKSDDVNQLAAEDLILGEEECDLGAIESMKIDISSVEAEYRRVLDEIKKVEEDTRILKKKNDVLIKCQKALKEKEADFLLKEEACKQKCASEVVDLEQQIRDLTFYVKTRKQMQTSPMKDELMEGSVVTVPQTNLKSDNSSNRGSRKGKK